MCKHREQPTLTSVFTNAAKHHVGTSKVSSWKGRKETMDTRYRDENVKFMTSEQTDEPV